MVLPNQADCTLGNQVNMKDLFYGLALLVYPGDKMMCNLKSVVMSSENGISALN